MYYYEAAVGRYATDVNQQRTYGSVGLRTKKGNAESCALPLHSGLGYHPNGRHIARKNAVFGCVIDRNGSANAASKR